MIIAVVGAGGKTSYIKKCAKEYIKQGKNVFVTTSTHMYIEEDTLLTDEPEQIIQVLEKNHYVMAGIPEGKKIKALSRETYEKVCAHADVVLIEADGSKHMPLKYPRAGEPVIYPNVEEIVVVCGLHALGKPLSETCHRLDLVKQCLGEEEDRMVEPHHIQKLIMEGYVRPLREQYPEKIIRIKPSHDGSFEQKRIAGMLEEEKEMSGVKSL